MRGRSNNCGYLARHPLLGASFTAWQKRWRLAGVGHLYVVNGIANEFFECDENVMASTRACLAPLFEERPYLAMPVFSPGHAIRQAAATFTGIHSADLISATGGIMAHPDGVAAGVAALRQAWQAGAAGVPVAKAAETSCALSHAMEAYVNA